MIIRYPKLRVSTLGVSFQWWHGWFNNGWHSIPVNYWGVWFRRADGSFRLKPFRRWSK